MSRFVTWADAYIFFLGSIRNQDVVESRSRLPSDVAQVFTYHIYIIMPKFKETGPDLCELLSRRYHPKFQSSHA